MVKSGMVRYTIFCIYYKAVGACQTQLCTSSAYAFCTDHRQPSRSQHDTEDKTGGNIWDLFALYTRSMFLTDYCFDRLILKI